MAHPRRSDATHPQRPPARLLPWLPVALQMLFLVWTRLAQSEVLVDDAFIHFRIACNLAEGEGLVYHPGQWIIGTTSPVFAALLGELHWATRLPLPQLARFVNFLADAGLVAFGLVWLRRAGVPTVWRHAIVLAVSAEPWRMFFSAAGMEMSLFLLAVAGVIESLVHGRWLAAGLLLGVIGWIRPEGAVLWPVMAAGLMHAGRRDLARRTLVSATATAAIFAAGLLLTYATCLPHSLIAKASAPWYAAPEGYSGLDFLLRFGELLPVNFATGYYPARASQAGLAMGNLVSLATVALAALGARRLARSGRLIETWGLAGFLAGYYLFYTLGNPQITFWYFVPLLWTGGMLVGLGAWDLTDRLASRPGPAGRGRTLAAAGVVFGAMALLTASSNAIHWDYLGRNVIEGLAFRHEGFDETTRERHYQRVASHLRNWRIDQQGARVGCTEIGIFGYDYGGRILDVYGLVSPEALEAAANAGRTELWPFNVLLMVEPELIMTHAATFPLPPASFDERYTPVPVPDDLDLLLYVRNDRKELVPWL